MFNRISIIILAIVCFISISINPAFAGSKAKVGKNKDCNSIAAHDAGNHYGWCKAKKEKKPKKEKKTKTSIINQCSDEIAILQNENDNLTNQILNLIAERDGLQNQINSMKSAAAAAPEPVVYDAEARKFAVYKMSADHPNTPGAYGVYTNFFVGSDQAKGLIEAMQSGLYLVQVVVTDPNGKVANIETNLVADVKPRNFYDHYVELTLP
jgi:hypothetical protein